MSPYDLPPLPKLRGDATAYLGAGATLSDCRRYRYDLDRSWSKGGPSATFIMLNPSTADGTEDDPTIRRCVGFARVWGCSSLVVVNLFALRATDPSELYKATDPIGPDNDATIRQHARNGSLVVAAWGAHGKFRGRDGQVLAMLQVAGVEVCCLGRTKDGAPKHPLYLSAKTERQILLGGR